MKASTSLATSTATSVSRVYVCSKKLFCYALYWLACCQWCFTTILWVSMTMRRPYMHYHLRHQPSILKWWLPIFSVFVTCFKWSLSCSSTVKYLAFLRKRMNTNPSRGPYHFRAPSRIFWRTVRGENEMLLQTWKFNTREKFLNWDVVRVSFEELTHLLWQKLINSVEVIEKFTHRNCLTVL